jgi:hypothetical protein
MRFCDESDTWSLLIINKKISYTSLLAIIFTTQSIHLFNAILEINKSIYIILTILQLITNVNNVLNIIVNNII